MSIICPKCGKEDISYFHDTVYKTIGMHCESCNSDFNVDSEDHTLLNSYISSFISFSYLNRTDLNNYTLFTLTNNHIIKVEKVIGGMKTYKEFNLEEKLYNSLLDFLIKKIYILDFPFSNIDKEEESDYINIKIEFENKPIIDYKYFKFNPPYIKVMNTLFETLLVEDK